MYSTFPVKHFKQPMQAWSGFPKTQRGLESKKGKQICFLYKALARVKGGKGIGAVVLCKHT